LVYETQRTIRTNSNCSSPYEFGLFTESDQMLKTMVAQLTRIIKRRENQSPRMVKGSRRRAGTGTGKNYAIW